MFHLEVRTVLANRVVGLPEFRAGRGRLEHIEFPLVDDLDIGEILAAPHQILVEQRHAFFRVAGKILPIRGLGHADIHKMLEEGKLDVEGHELTPDDFLIDRNEKEGMVVSSEGGITIALDTQLTDALKVEGDARELVNRIQTQRKEADFNVEDRIFLAIDADDWLTACLEAHGDYVSGETLAITPNSQDFEAESVKEWDVNGKKVTVRIRRA